MNDRFDPSPKIDTFFQIKHEFFFHLKTSIEQTFEILAQAFTSFYYKKKLTNTKTMPANSGFHYILDPRLSNVRTLRRLLIVLQITKAPSHTQKTFTGKIP